PRKPPKPAGAKKVRGGRGRLSGVSRTWWQTSGVRRKLGEHQAGSDRQPPTRHEKIVADQKFKPNSVPTARWLTASASRLCLACPDAPVREHNFAWSSGAR